MEQFHKFGPPGTPQHNGVSERHNHTLLDMVQSMMSLTDLSLSFWGYALETTAFTLIGHHVIPLRRHCMNYALARNLSCRFLKFGVAMLKVAEVEIKEEHQVLMVNKTTTLLQDAANATLRSETLRRNCVRCNNRKWWCKNRQKGAKLLRWRSHQTRFRF